MHILKKINIKALIELIGFHLLFRVNSRCYTTIDCEKIPEVYKGAKKVQYSLFRVIEMYGNGHPEYSTLRNINDLKEYLKKIMDPKKVQRDWITIDEIDDNIIDFNKYRIEVVFNYQKGYSISWLIEHSKGLIIRLTTGDNMPSGIYPKSYILLILVPADSPPVKKVERCTIHQDKWRHGDPMPP